MSEKLGQFKHPNLTINAYRDCIDELVKLNNLQFTKFHDELLELADELEQHMFSLVNSINHSIVNIKSAADDLEYEINYLMDKR